MPEASQQHAIHPNHDRLLAFATGNLGDTDATEIELHLESCRDCGAAFDQLPLAEDQFVVRLRKMAEADDIEERLSSTEPFTISNRIGMVADATSSRIRLLKEAAESLSFLAPPAGEDELGRLGQFRIRGVLAAGGMGVVFQAEDMLLGREVAIKVIQPGFFGLPEAHDRFVREARAVAALEHDNIVPIYQVGVERGLHFLVMPRLRGETLASVLERNSRLSLPDTLRIAREIAQGLAAAHAAGVIHRDIKPSNLWIEAATGRVKILDFGLAQLAADNANDLPTVSRSGTPEFMAPEQRAGAPTDFRCDLYALGVVLWRMCVGNDTTIPADRPLDVCRLLADARRANPNDVSPLGNLLASLLSHDPAARPDAAAKVVDSLLAIERAAVQSSGHADAANSSAAKTGVRRRAILKWSLLATLTVAIATLAIWSIFFQPQRPPELGMVFLKSELPGVFVVIRQGEQEASVLDGVDYPSTSLPPGEYTAELSEPIAGATVAPTRFTSAPGARTQITVNFAKPEEADLNPDQQSAFARELVVWVFSKRGAVQIADRENKQRLVLLAANLPTDAFRVEVIDIPGNAKLRDDDVAFLTQYRQLGSLTLRHAPVTDEACKHLATMPRLWLINFGWTEISDVGLRRLVPLRTLFSLNLEHTLVSDAGLACLAAFPDLQALDLGFTNVSDRGAAHIAQLRLLERLRLSGTRITDAALPAIGRLRRMRFLDLAGTQISDAGLRHLEELDVLEKCVLSSRGITADGINRLREKLPRCKVDWDGEISTATP
jgi:serine/threonine protein kinase